MGVILLPRIFYLVIYFSFHFSIFFHYFLLQHQELCSYKRPGLDAFVNFCFTHFQSVSLWTAGTQEYAEFIARSIAPPGYQFMFVLSRIHCRDHPVHEGTLVKDMNGMFLHHYQVVIFSLTKTNNRFVAVRGSKDLQHQRGELVHHR